MVTLMGHLGVPPLIKTRRLDVMQCMRGVYIKNVLLPRILTIE
jgi:hypothetical protein